jgi:hypothetical protein
MKVEGVRENDALGLKEGVDARECVIWQVESACHGLE